MNDDELITLLRDQRDRISMATPVAEIIGRGRVVRGRRRVPRLAGAMAAAAGAVAAGAVAAVAMLVPGTHPAAAQLAAWTVTRQADGDVTLTIRELSNPDGLAAALQRDGVPAFVAFAGQPGNVSCQVYPNAASLLRSIYSVQPGGDGTAIVIDPSAIPSGAGLSFLDVPARALPTASPIPLPSASAALYSPPPRVVIGDRYIRVNLVSASQTCPVDG
jgi:hypothetical protein